MAERRADATSLLAATYTPSRSPASGMKQKFYSQVNMERIFFFERARLGAKRRNA
jgi:hypothetical protein